MPIRLNNLPGLISQADKVGPGAKARTSSAGSSAEASKGAAPEAPRTGEAAVLARRSEPETASAVADAKTGVEEATELAAQFASNPGLGVQAQASRLSRAALSLVS